MVILNRRSTVCLGLGLAVAFSLSMPAEVLAQRAQADSPSPVSVLALDELTTYARKREENIQDLGLSVSAMGKREIESKFGTDLRDLVDISPNLVLDDTAQGPGGVAAAYIRGIGVSEVEKNFDPAVGVVVDGIFLGTMTGSLTRAIDLERVEVLRGPQGTLFGRNTIGGVINLQRTKPTGELGGKFRVGYGNYETTKVDGLFNFALGEQVAVKLTGTYHDQGEGYYDNLITGTDEGRSEYTSFGFNPLWTPMDNLEIEYTFQIERTDQDTPPLLNVGQPGQLFCDGFGFCSPSVQTPVSGDRYKTLNAYQSDAIETDPAFFNNQSPRDTTFDADTHIFEIRWDINDAYRLDYILGSWETEEDVFTDFDAVPDLLFHTDRPAEYEQTTHELRLTYDEGGALSGTVGAYLWESEYEIRLLSFIGFAVADTVLTLPQTSKQESESWAVFFEGDYAFNDQWTLTLGGRFTTDDKDTDQAGVVTATASDDWTEFTPKIGVKYQYTDDVMFYGLYSAGYRSGGFNGRVDSPETATTPYDQETVDNYEIGFKSELLDNRLRLNGNIFYMEYDDKQEEIQQPSATSGTGQVTRVVNASTATISGIEIDALWIAAEGLDIRANLGYLDAEYDDFSLNTGTTAMPVITDFSNLEFRRAPEITAGISGTYEWELGRGRAWVGAGWHYIDDHQVDFANKPEVENDAQHLVDASVNYELENWQFSVFGRNILDEDGYGIGFDVAGLWTYAAPRAPTTFGFEASYQFGE